MTNSYLQHHGILGMKWGVRRYQNKDGSLTPAGKNRKSRQATKVLNRLSKVESDGDRMSRMSSRQKQSLKNAKAYWKQVEKSGEYNTGKIKRNIIQREADRYRSHSLGERAAITGTSQAISVAGSTYLQKKGLMNTGVGDVDVSAASVGSSWVTSTAGGMLISELENKVFGHF